MSFLAFWLLGIVLIVAQTTVVQYLPSWLDRPDFIFILVAFIAYRFAWIPGVLLVFSLGWIIDVVAAVHLGIYPLTCLIVFAALKVVSSRRLIKESTFQIPLVGIGYFLMQFFYYIVYSVLLSEDVPEWSWGVAFQRTALVVVSAVPLFMLCNSLFEYLQKRRIRGKAPRRRRPKAV